MQGSTAAATNACMREKLQASAYGSFVGFKPFLSIGLGWTTDSFPFSFSFEKCFIRRGRHAHNGRRPPYATRNATAILWCFIKNLSRHTSMVVPWPLFNLITLRSKKKMGCGGGILHYNYKSISELGGP